MLQRLDTPLVRFLIAGGSLSLLNLALRFGFDLAVPFRVAVGVAGALTVALSFFVYRSLVFRDTAPVTMRAMLIFVAVNLVGLAVTIGVAAAALRGFASAEWVATCSHALGIVAGAAVTFPLYRATTFVSRK